MSGRGRRSRRLAAALVFAAAWLGAASAGDAPAPASEQAPRSPLVADVLRMLEEGVEPDLVLAWLEGRPETPVRVRADDMIALSAAGASDALVRELLRRGAAEAPEVGGQAAVAGASGEAVDFEFSLRYRPQVGEDPLDTEIWGLYAYLDGRILTWVEPRRSPFSRDETAFSERIAPGTHVLRLLLERHEDRPGDGNGRLHRARVGPVPIVFEALAGEPGSLQVVVSDGGPGLGRSGPLTWRLTHGDRRVAGEEKVGARLADWDPLCEELETATEPGGEPPRWLRRELGRCVRWEDLWPGVAAVPSRDEVREALGTLDYRPVPTNAR